MNASDLRLLFQLLQLGAFLGLGSATNAYPAILDPVRVPSSDGVQTCWKKSFEVKGFLPLGWTAQVHTVYCPLTGLAASGWNTETNWVSLEGRLIGFEFYPGVAYASISTNRYPARLEDPTAVFAAELSGFTNGPRRFTRLPQHRIDLKRLFGRAAFYDVIDSQGGHIYSTQSRPSEWQGVSMENSNAVVSFLIRPDIVAKVAFNRSLRPVWATTNGVSIGPIPTNSVFFTDIVEGKEVIRVVY